MAKMYYNEQEAAQKLNVAPADLDRFVRDQKLRVYRDGANKMYKSAEVDALAAELAPDEIELAPADTADGLRLTETDAPRTPGKDDTVISAEGISIFDDGDLQIESADPMAKTQISAAIEDQVAIDGVGSGSGLLDLTRESDDTSLGAEVLDHIDMEGAVGTGLVTEAPPAVATYAAPEVVVAADSAQMDGSSGAFSGIATALMATMLLLGAVTVTAIMGKVPDFVQWLSENTIIMMVIIVVLALIGALVGYFVGKGAAERQAAMRNVA
jgi:hypothetical protein